MKIHARDIILKNRKTASYVKQNRKYPHFDYKSNCFDFDFEFQTKISTRKTINTGQKAADEVINRIDFASVQTA